MKSESREEKEFKTIYMPSLLYILNAHETDKGSDLTEKEVNQLCDKANIMMVEISRIKEIGIERGYQDIDSKDLWKEWLAFKERMNDSMNKNYSQQIKKNLHKRISAHIQFVKCKFHLLRRIWPKVKLELVNKFGGRPCIIDQSEWPLSKKTGQPMKFICQIVLDPNLFPNSDGRMVYLFMTDHADVVNTWDPMGGENAVVIKSIKEQKITRRNLYNAKGPSLDAEYRIKFAYKEEPNFVGDDWNESQYEEYFNNVEGNKIAGSPSYVQRDVPQIGRGWRLLLQLDSSDTPFEIDFGGGGVGYLFINEDYSKGKFLWQCD